MVDPQDCGVLYGTLHIQVERDQVQNENVRMHERLLRSEKVRISFMQCIVNYALLHSMSAMNFLCRCTKQQIALSENVVASKQSAIVRLWAESDVDKVRMYRMSCIIIHSIFVLRHRAECM